MPDADYFNLSRGDEAEARAAPRCPAPNQAKRALAHRPSTSAQQKRDKAVFALLWCLTDVRVTALVSHKIKHVDLQKQSITQNPREVTPKFGKAIDTFLAKGFNKAEFRFRSKRVYVGSLETTEPLRKIIHIAFEAAGIHNYGPHAFRHMQARHIAKSCTSIAELEGTSQNLGHTAV